MSKGPRRKWLAARVVAVTLLLGGTTGAAYETQRRVLPPDGSVARGVVFDGHVVGRGEDAAGLVQRRADAWLARRVVLRHGDAILVEGTLQELGATADVIGVAAFAVLCWTLIRSARQKLES